jgi:putative tryptophan/tyrosine transport system substrate-binding protein
VQGMGAMGLAMAAGCGRWPGQAAPAPKVARIGVLASPEPIEEAGYELLRHALRDLGYVEGQNLVLEPRFPEEREAMLSVAADLVRLPVDVIVAGGITATIAARDATSTIPIVKSTGSGDLVAAGLAASLARPGGNVTGFSGIAPQLSGKRLELLKEVASPVTRIAVLWNANNPAKAVELEETRAAAEALGLQIHSLAVRAEPDIEGAFTLATSERAGALVAFDDRLLIVHRAEVIGQAALHRLPAMYSLRRFVDAGGLMAYGPNQGEVHRRTAAYIDKILKGTNPAVLPIEQPTTFEFVINLKTAQALGLTIPHHILLQATEVIQ